MNSLCPRSESCDDLSLHFNSDYVDDTSLNLTVLLGFGELLLLLLHTTQRDVKYSSAISGKADIIDIVLIIDGRSEAAKKCSGLIHDQHANLFPRSDA